MGLELPKPCLCLVTDRRIGGEGTLVQRVVEAVAGGVGPGAVEGKGPARR